MTDRGKPYKIRYTIESGEFYPQAMRSGQDTVYPRGIRVLANDPDSGYTDNICVCSILRNDDGEIASVLWAIDPNLSRQEAMGILESLSHHLINHYL